MLARLLEPGTHSVEEIEGGRELEIEVRSDPSPVTVQLLNEENFARFERDEEYEYLGPDLASKDHEFVEELDDGPWYLLVLNETDENVAIATETYDADEEEEDDEDDEQEDEGEDVESAEVT